MTACEYYGHPSFLEAARGDDGATGALLNTPARLHENLNPAYVDTKTVCGKLESFFVPRLSLLIELIGVLIDLAGCTAVAASSWLAPSEYLSVAFADVL